MPEADWAIVRDFVIACVLDADFSNTKYNSRPEARREQFIARAREIHGDRYDYSAVIYVDQRTAVPIICPDHGPFPQRPMNHLSSHTPSKCHNCGHATRTKTKRANRAEIVPAWPSYWN